MNYENSDIIIEVEAQILQAFYDNDAANRRIEDIESIGDLAHELREAALCPDTKDALTKVVDHCCVFLEEAYAESEKSVAQYKVAMIALQAIEGRQPESSI